MVLKKYSSAFSILIIIASIYFSFYSLLPKVVAETDTTETEFSIQKALVHLKNISKKPHYTGSIEHTVVRNYLVDELKKLGLEVEVQEQVAINSRRTATNTKNILARIKGSEKGKALLLLSHYDSSPHSSFGASERNI